MLTLACSEIVFKGLFQAYDYTGSDNGITNFMPPRFGLTAQVYAAMTIVVVGLCIGLLASIVRSPLGLAIQAVGEEPHRAAALGFSPRIVQLIACVIAGTLAGTAGTMYSVFHGNAFPDYAGMSITVDALVMVVIGGVKGFYGGVFGAVIYVLLKTFVSRAFTHWELVIGLILIAVVLIFPTGVAGLLRQLGFSRTVQTSGVQATGEQRS
jgi:branched-chain amino acid transport system permease protein